MHEYVPLDENIETECWATRSGKVFFALHISPHQALKTTFDLDTAKRIYENLGHALRLAERNHANHTLEFDPSAPASPGEGAPHPPAHCPGSPA